MIRSFSVTDIGRKRQLNQDFVFTSELPLGCLPNLFVVADGMGGHKAGDFASKYTVETIVQEIAEAVGYLNANSFYKAYKRCFGETPISYRNRA